ncbi:hypothetical protein [Antarcticirhabdus aurantiaca]|uniref:Uncharacterized protein n=1 Tax=Antarcticirhabdus aurantiaca TaxID=2606717 RepID=A0ACD4NVE9_9HYPH|nr:hypothetical protein [Antarcticirhabdus aurantiaca]WAJ30514.1 hypothetical protein OXU80_10045 [Jeongeuplla avenae]
MPGHLVDADDARMLVEIGFIALSAGLDRDAEAIFSGVSAARPGGEAGPIGLALVHLARNEPARAVALLRPLPPTDAALAYLGLALAREGSIGEARRILADVAQTASGTPFGDLAEATLAELRGG